MQTCRNGSIAFFCSSVLAMTPLLAEMSYGYALRYTMPLRLPAHVNQCKVREIAKGDLLIAAG